MSKLTELYTAWEKAGDAYSVACRFRSRADENCAALFKDLLIAQRKLYVAIIQNTTVD